MTLPLLGSVNHQPSLDVRASAEPTFRELTEKHPEAAQAAQQFEAVFLKQLLSSVEKASMISGGSETQSQVVGSMMSTALSDQMSQAGGIGLSEVILRAMLANLPDEPKPAEGTQPASDPATRPIP